MEICVKGMEMPTYCIGLGVLHSTCPMDRLRCIQEFAPKNITKGQALKEQTQTGKLPSWCPLIELKEREDGLYERVS